MILNEFEMQCVPVPAEITAFNKPKKKI